MAWQIIGIIAAALTALLFLFKRLAGQGSKLSRHPYQKQAVLFSADERAFFSALKNAVGGEYEIFGKFRVDAIIQPKKGASREAFEAIEDRHFDFVLCDKASLAPVCAIQLRDRTEDSPADPLPSICESLSLPLLRISIHADYAVEAIQERLRKAMVKEPFYLVETDGRKEPRISNIDDMKF